MNRRRLSMIFVLAAIGVAAASSTASAQSASGAVLANTCHSCHGTDGRSAGAMPSIAGKTSAFIIDAMKRFKAGKRDATVMDRIAKGFSDSEIEALATHFSAK